MAQFPSKAIAERSFIYRTLGIGYANIGGLLMTSGIPYDSAEGRAIAGAITAVMTGVSYATSAEMAGELGAVPAITSATPSTCCASSATTAAPRTASPTATRACRSPRSPLDHASLKRRRTCCARAKAVWDDAPARSAKSTATATPRSR